MLNQIKTSMNFHQVSRITRSKIRSILALTATVGICFALSACSGSPTESDLKSAVQNKMKSEYEAMMRTSGNQAMPVQPEIQNVRKLSCKDEGEKTYRCEVELDVLHNGVAAKGSTSMLFSKNGDDWIVKQ